MLVLNLLCVPTSKLLTLTKPQFLQIKEIHNIDATHWWRIRVKASLFNHFSFLLFSSPISSFIPFAYSGFSFYALSCPSVVMLLFLFSLFIIFTKNNNFHPFNGYDGFSVPAQHHFPLFSKLIGGLPYVMLLWRDFQLNCPDFFQ